MVSKYGIRTKNYQAGSLFQCNIGVREKYDDTNAMFVNNLLMYYLLDNGLIVNKGETRDIICIGFEYGSRSYDEEVKHLTKMIKNSDGKYNEDQIKNFESLLVNAHNKKDLFEKKSADELRELFYRDGVEIKWGKKKSEFIHYKMLYRSTGKAKAGECMFICDRLYDVAIDFIRMGLQLPDKNVPIVEMSAYSSLIASSLQDGVSTIHINPKDILILEDVDSFFTTNVISIETDENKHCYAKAINDYRLKNTMFDGQGLIDESIFPKSCDGYVLLREHMFKAACFKTKIQKFFREYYGDNYNTATIKDMFGNEHRVKDIKLITTDNACKWLKFIEYGATYDYWCKKVIENKSMFGIVKTAHKSKLGDVQRMSYQMINTLYLDAMPKVVERSVKYIEELKSNDEVFLQYLRENNNFSNDYDVLVDLCEHNPEFVRSQYFRDRRKSIISTYVANFRFGKVIQNADNLVFVGSPYAMLLHTVGEDVEDDPTFECESDTIQCYTGRFKDKEYLCGFRSPHNSRNNILYLHNHYHEYFDKYFDLGEQILVLNTLHTDVQDRANGCDFDSDSGYITNFPEIVECARKSYRDFPTIVNNIPKDKNKYDNRIESYIEVDNKLSHAQAAIGTSSNLAQIAQTYMFNFNDQKFVDYVCILSVLA